MNSLILERLPLTLTNGPLGILVGWVLFLSLLIGLVGARWTKQRIAWVTTIGLGVAVGLSGWVWLNSWSEPLHVRAPWLEVKAVGTLYMGLYADRLGALMCVLITGIASLVALYSHVYMEHSARFHRYWGYLTLFVGAMLVIVLADNLLLMFGGWELVGMSSYLLIGFERTSVKAGPAAQKAFLINRIGDVCFLGGLIVCGLCVGTLDWVLLLAPIQEGGASLQAIHGNMMLQMAILAILGGAIAKSAQFPLQVWLPDAMAGPTPVSALIHAATMVAAGVYLGGRLMLLLQPSFLMIWAGIGTLTALLAAIAACAQWDIKRILAYSTLSQLGYMFIGLGVMGREMALLHLFTHAFFKAGLFLIAGVIIHQRKEGGHPSPQDIRTMGGLRHYMPWLYGCFLVCAAALVGLPFTAGFLSKDGILLAAWQLAHETGGWTWCIPVVGFFTAMLTAAYMMRVTRWVFWGEDRVKSTTAVMRDPHWKMLLPIVLLSLGCGWFWVAANPFDGQHGWLVQALLPEGSLPGASHTLLVPIVSVVMAAIGLAIGYVGYQWTIPKSLFNLAHTHFYQDQIYEWIGGIWLRIAQVISWIDHQLVDGLVNLVASVVVSRKHASIAHTLAHTDKQAIDQPIEQAAKLVVSPLPNRPSLSRISTWLDDQVVDGMVNGFVKSIGRLGRFFQSWQNGNIQGYLIGALLMLLAMVGGLIWVFG